MERTYSDKSEWPSEKHSEAIMKAPHMEGGLLESMRTTSPSPLIVISGNQGRHAYNVAEPNHCKGARSARETKPPTRNVRGARGWRRRGGRRRREDAIEQVLLKRIEAGDEHEHRHRLAFGPEALACACKLIRCTQKVDQEALIVIIVISNQWQLIRCTQRIHQEALEQGALTGIMLDSRRGLALNGTQWHSRALTYN